MRLEREDLIDDLWTAHTEAMRPARQAFGEAVLPALAEYQRTVEPAAAQRQQKQQEAQAILQRGVEDSVLAAESQEEAERLAAELVQLHEQAMRLIEAEYQAVAALPTAALEAAQAKAAFPYRKAAVQAHRQLAAQFAGHSPSAEPGRYLGCSECLPIYRPRIIERLKRIGAIKPGVPDEAIGGDWLM
jgi:small-conductance mechanosensitive channel